MKKLLGLVLGMAVTAKLGMALPALLNQGLGEVGQ